MGKLRKYRMHDFPILNHVHIKRKLTHGICHNHKQGNVHIEYFCT